MSTTKSDIAMDKFVDIEELNQMDVENLEDFLDRVTLRLNALIEGAKETELDRMDEYASDIEEGEIYDDDGNIL